MKTVPAAHQAQLAKYLTATGLVGKVELAINDRNKRECSLKRFVGKDHQYLIEVHSKVLEEGNETSFSLHVRAELAVILMAMNPRNKVPASAQKVREIIEHYIGAEKSEAFDLNWTVSGVSTPEFDLSPPPAPATPSGHNWLYTCPCGRTESRVSRHPAARLPKLVCAGCLRMGSTAVLTWIGTGKQPK